MKRHTLIAVAALGLSLVGGTALADSNNNRDHRSDHGPAARHDSRSHDRHDYNDRRVDHRTRDHHYDGHRDYRSDWNRDDRHYDGRQIHRAPVRYRVVRYYPPHNYRPYSWYRGAYLPAAYYAPRYVVYNYRDYRLAPPPYGYHWVRVNNDVVLAAITTGLVMQVVNGLFY